VVVGGGRWRWVGETRGKEEKEEEEEEEEEEARARSLPQRDRQDGTAGTAGGRQTGRLAVRIGCRGGCNMDGCSWMWMVDGPGWMDGRDGMDQRRGWGSWRRELEEPPQPTLGTGTTLARRGTPRLLCLVERLDRLGLVRTINHQHHHPVSLPRRHRLGISHPGTHGKKKARDPALYRPATLDLSPGL